MTTHDPDEETAQFSAAAACLRDAVRFTDRAVARVAWRRRQARLAESLDLLGADDPDPAHLKASIAAGRRALGAFAPDDRSLARGEVLSQLALAEANLAATTSDIRRLHRAEQLNREALTLLSRRHSQRGFVRVNLSLGEILADLGEAGPSPALLEAAIKCLRAAIAVDLGHGRPLRADALFLVARTLVRLGEVRAGWRYFRDAAEAFHRSGETFREEGAMEPSIRAEVYRGYALQSLGERRGDRSILLKALEVNAAAARRARPRLYPDLWADAQVAHALALQSLAEFDADPPGLQRALEVLDRARTVHSRERSEGAWAVIEHNRGTLLSRRGELLGEPRDLRQAIEAFEGALDTDLSAEARALSINGLAIARQRLGGLLSDSGLLEQAVADYDEQLALAQSAGIPLDRGRVFNNRGTVLQELGERSADAAFFERAEVSFLEALKAYSRKEAPLDWAMVQLNRGGAMLGHGEVTRSVARLEPALGCLRGALTVYRAGSPLEYAKTQQNIGRAHGELFGLAGDVKHLHAAVRAYHAALMILDRNGAAEQRPDTSSYLAHALVRLGRYDEAEPLLEATIRRSGEAIVSASYSPESRDHTVDQVGDLHALLSLCRLRRRTPDVLGAFHAAGAGRARLLEETGAGPSRRAAGGRSGALPRSSDRAIRRLVGEDGALVMPVLTAEAAFAFVVTRHGIEVILLPALTHQDADRQVFAINGWLDVYSRTVAAPAFTRQDKGAATPDYKRWNAAIDRVRAWSWTVVMGPIDAHLRTSACLADGAPVVPLAPGLLSPFPLAAASPGDDLPTFADRWTVSSAPSLEALNASRARAGRQQGPARLVAAIDPGANGSRLPGARLEGEFLAKRFGALRPAILKGPDATLEGLLRHLSKATHFVAATHGRHDRDRPRGSSLSLADGDLTPQALGPGALQHMRLAYLAACESGLTGLRRLEDEFLGLPTAFLMAGAGCVIASLWPVFDDAAYLMTRRFFELHLTPEGREALCPAAALAQAQAWLRTATAAELAPVLRPAGRGTTSLSEAALRFDTLARPAARRRPDPAFRPFADPHEWAGFVVIGV